MSFVTEEIASQPDCWLEAARLARESSTRAALPAAGARVAIIGCGTSLFMAQACAALREALGAGETDPFPASEFPATRTYDHVVALTRSGTTTEVLDVLKRIAPDTATTVITTGLELPAAQLARHTIALSFADEHSVVQTRFATTTLALWRAWLGEEIEPLAEAAAAAISALLPPAVLNAGKFTFVGRGWAAGLANEAALKAREAAQLWTESYPAMELRHGPISILDADSVAWFFGPAPEGLLEQAAATGAVVLSSGEDPVVELVRAQRVAVAIAQARGLDPDAPRNLTRSIVLDDTP